VPQVRRMATKLSLVSENSSPGGGAMTSVLTSSGDGGVRTEVTAIVERLCSLSYL
jgi:hypothetical protein